MSRGGGSGRSGGSSGGRGGSSSGGRSGSSGGARSSGGRVGGSNAAFRSSQMSSSSSRAKGTSNFGGSSGGLSGNNVRSGGIGSSSPQRSGAAQNKNTQSYGAGYGHRAPHPPVFFGPRYRRPRGWGYRGYYYGGVYRNPVAGVFSAIIWLGFLFLAFLVIISSSGGSSGNITRSTIKREALPKGAASITPYYIDEVNWIDNSSALEKGMKSFYSETGVQPVLFITDEILGTHYPSEAELETWAYAKYDELFDDEAHLLLLFLEYDNSYVSYYMNGSLAKTVIDTEAGNILLDYIDKYYYDSNLSEAQFFSKAFSSAGKDIMKVYKSPWVTVAILAIVAVILFMLIRVWKSRAKRKAEEAERLDNILNTPLEKFGSTEVDSVVDKYTD